VRAVAAVITPQNAAPLFFLVDPLDGTRDFLAGSEQYCVNIGLIQGARAVVPAAQTRPSPGAAKAAAIGRSP
jgi:3'(2'), 5'-bisphosphate nucleotidase